VTEVCPITGADVPAVARFLHHHLNRRVAADTWQRAMVVPWKVDAPNHGYLLRDGDRVVGAYLAFYSDRTLDGRPERFCNLGAWCVLPGHRCSRRCSPSPASTSPTCPPAAGW
jgi:hypothetical protein